MPVFSVLVQGFLLGKTNVVSHSEATTLNRVAFILLQPPLIFLLLSQVNLDTLQYLAILSYGVGQALIFTMTYLLCRYVLRHDVLESWLLGMATIFVNSLLYIWLTGTGCLAHVVGRVVKALVTIAYSECGWTVWSDGLRYCNALRR